MKCALSIERLSVCFCCMKQLFLVFLFDFFLLFLHFFILFVIFFDSIDYFRFCCFPTKIIHYERDKKKRKKNCCRWNSICEYHSNMHFFHIRAHPVPFVLARSLLASFAYFILPHNMWTISIKIMNKWNKDLFFFLTLTVYAFVKDITITKSFQWIILEVFFFLNKTTDENPLTIASTTRTAYEYTYIHTNPSELIRTDKNLIGKCEGVEKICRRIYKTNFVLVISHQIKTRI